MEKMISKKYKAFISYKHDVKSRRLAQALESELTSFAKPIFSKRIKIFRDEHYITPTLDLPNTIESALINSEFLIYIASKEAAESQWVQKELNYWIHDLKRLQNLIIILVDGKIINDQNLFQLDWDLTDALPDNLREAIDSIPFYLDLRGIQTKDYNINYNQFRTVVKTITAFFRNLDPNEIEGEEIRVAKRNALIKKTVIYLLSGLLFATILLTVFYFDQKTDALLSKNRVNILLSEQYMLNEKWPEALTILSQTMVNSPYYNNNETARLIFANRAQSYLPIEKILPSYPAPCVVKWRNYYYFIDQHQSIWQLNEDDIDFWYFDKTQSRLLTLSDYLAENIIRFYRSDEKELIPLTSTYSLVNYSISNLYQTGYHNFILAKIGASIHERTIYGYNQGFALINTDNDESAAFIEGKLCDNYISTDKKKIRITCTFDSPPSDFAYNLSFSYDFQNLNEFNPANPIMIPLKQIPQIEWIQLKETTPISLEKPLHLNFPKQLVDVDYKNWFYSDAQTNNIKWKSMPLEGDDSMYGFYNRWFTYPDLNRFVITKDSGGTCGRHYKFSPADASNKKGELLNLGCIDGYGPWLISNNAKYLFISYEPSKRDMAFSIWDFEKEMGYYAPEYNAGEIEAGFATFSDQNEVFVLTQRGRIYGYKMLQVSPQKTEYIEIIEDSMSWYPRLELILDGINVIEDANFENAEYPGHLNALYCSNDRLVIVGSKKIIIYNKNNGEKKWETTRDEDGYNLQDISISADGEIMAVMRDTKITLYAMKNGIKLTQELFTDQIAKQPSKISLVKKEIIQSEYAKAIYKNVFWEDTKKLFWLPDGSLGCQIKEKVFIRKLPDLDETQLNNFHLYSGKKFDNRLMSIKKLPTAVPIRPN